jgi:hypothetical protein
MEYTDWWNRSWIPARRFAFFGGLTIFFNLDESSGGLLPYDQGGAIPSHETWLEIVEAVQKFYTLHTDTEIDRYNWESLAHKEMKTGDHHQAEASPKAGYVYLLKGGPYHKIGLSSNPGRRMEEISPRLPFGTELVCTIATEDMRGLESHLHEQFADKRANGEWFELDEADVAYIRRLADE